MLDIIIPAYNAHDTIFQTLSSICVQDFKELVNVYIINDCSDNDYSSFVKDFSKYINIKELKLEKNSGPGVARQYGIDHSSSKYIMFLDADDQLVNPFSLRKIFQVLRKEDCDLCSGILIEEKNCNLNFYQNHHGVLHGKVYKRKFIEEHNIKFRDSRSSEDSAFNNLFNLYNPKVSLLNYNVYFYRERKNSITHSSKLTSNYKYMYYFSENLCATVEEGIINNCNEDLIIDLLYNSIIYVYKEYALSRFESKKNILKYSYTFIKYIDKYKNIITKDRFRELYNGFIDDSMDLSVTFDEFIDLVINYSDR